MNRITTLALAAALALPMLATPRGADAQRGERAPRAEGRHHHDGEGHHGPRRLEHRLRMMTAMLGLDPNQVAAVREILTATRAQAETLRAAAPGEGRREQMHALHEQAAERIDAVLTPAQREIFDRMRAFHREMREERRERRER